MTTSKNCLTREELTELNRLTTMFLDFVGDRARRRQQILMTEWVEQADRFLDFHERAVLDGPGRASATQAEEAVAARYEEFDRSRRAIEAEVAESEELRDLTEQLGLEGGSPADGPAPGSP